MTWNVKVKGELSCRSCGALATDLHHIVPRSQSRRAHNLTYNAMGLCHACHMAHHHRERLLTRDLLRDTEIAFITGCQGEGWLDLWYPIRDEVFA